MVPPYGNVMSRARTQRVASLVVAWALASGAAHAQPRCTLVITPSVAQRLFRDLAQLPVAEGCAFDDITTASSRVTLRWLQQGRALPAVTLEPAACAASGAPTVGSYALRSPPEFERACPTAARGLRTLLAGGSVEPTLVGVPTGARRRSHLWVFVGLAAALFAALWARDLLRRRAAAAQRSA